MKLNRKTMVLLMGLATTTAFAATSSPSLNGDLHQIQMRWAQVNYQLQDDDQEEAFEELLTNAKQFSEQYPDNAESWIWLGIVQSSYAGAKGGLGALSLAKAAKKSLEKAIKIDDTALSGSAYTSLGTLYHQAPGWPIGFGDDDKAQELLEKALTINPEGIDSNYFYGQYLFDERKYSKAKNYLLKAQQAPARENRPLADKSRHQEINQLMAKLEKKLKKKSKKS